MAYNNFQQKDMTGTLFLNDRKVAEKQPDYRGTAIIKGKTVSVSAWVKTSKRNGNKYLSLSFQYTSEHPDITKFKKTKPVEDNRLTFDEGFGEPQNEFEKQIDEFDNKLNADTEDTNIPF